MACKGCGTTDFKERLGKCPYCIGLALMSAVGFWSLYYVLRQSLPIKPLLSLVGGFASLVTLLLVAHVLAFLADRNKARISK